MVTHPSSHIIIVVVVLVVVACDVVCGLSSNAELRLFTGSWNSRCTFLFQGQCKCCAMDGGIIACVLCGVSHGFWPFFMGLGTVSKFQNLSFPTFWTMFVVRNNHIIMVCCSPFRSWNSRMVCVGFQRCLFVRSIRQDKPFMVELVLQHLFLAASWIAVVENQSLEKCCFEARISKTHD